MSSNQRSWYAKTTVDKKRLLYGSIYHAVAWMLVYTCRTAISVIQWEARLDVGTEYCSGGGRQLIKPAMRYPINLQSLQIMYVEPMVGCPTVTHTFDPVYVNQIGHSLNPHCLKIQERTMVMGELYLFRNLAPRVMTPIQLVGSARMAMPALICSTAGMVGKGGSAHSS